MHPDEGQGRYEPPEWRDAYENAVYEIAYGVYSSIPDADKAEERARVVADAVSEFFASHRHVPLFALRYGSSAAFGAVIEAGGLEDVALAAQEVMCREVQTELAGMDETLRIYSTLSEREHASDYIGGPESGEPRMEPREGKI